MYVGSWFAYKRAKLWEHPTKTSAIPRQRKVTGRLVKNQELCASKNGTCYCDLLLPLLPLRGPEDPYVVGMLAKVSSRFGPTYSSFSSYLLFASPRLPFFPFLFREWLGGEQNVWLTDGLCSGNKSRAILRRQWTVSWTLSNATRA